MLAIDIKLAVLNELAKMRFTYSTAYKLMKLIENPENDDIRSSIFFTLLGIPNKTFYDVFKLSKRDREYIINSSNGDVVIYGINFAKISKKAA